MPTTMTNNGHEDEEPRTTLQMVHSLRGGRVTFTTVRKKGNVHNQQDHDDQHMIAHNLFSLDLMAIVLCCHHYGNIFINLVGRTLSFPSVAQT